MQEKKVTCSSNWDPEKKLGLRGAKKNQHLIYKHKRLKYPRTQYNLTGNI